MREKDRYRFVIYMLERADTATPRIVVEKHSRKEDKTYSDCVEELMKAGGCRYAIVNYPYRGARGQMNEKLLFIVWCPRGSSQQCVNNIIYTSHWLQSKKIYLLSRTDGT